MTLAEKRKKLVNIIDEAIEGQWMPEALLHAISAAGFSIVEERPYVSGEQEGLLMKYFVLKPRGNDPYANASRAAMLRYAVMINAENPTLAAELNEWAIREHDAMMAEKDAG